VVFTVGANARIKLTNSQSNLMCFMVRKQLRLNNEYGKTFFRAQKYGFCCEGMKKTGVQLLVIKQL
jgi:hypothetical protein